MHCKQVDRFDIEVAEDLGEIVLVKIEDRKYIVKNDWYCRYIKVKTPSGETLEFPCYRWVVNDQEVVLRDGRARLPQDDKTSLLKEHRRKELETRKKTYRWREWQPGLPMTIDAHTYKELPLDIQFDSKKTMDFTINYYKAIGNLGLNKFMEMFQSSWDDLDDFKEIFVKISSTPAEYVMQHWKEDFVFAYQFLNGCNPVMIRKCTKLPAKFPVTHEMVEFCLERHLTLEEEIKAGNIYIVDYEIMENITPNGTDPSTTQYLAAPICLLYKNTKNKIQPIAIQLGQNPGENSPIFLPNDEDCDWTLAKMWVRSSDFSVHQTITHLLRTHLISEVFGIALFRQLPAVHPVYKANGVADEGFVELVQKAMKTFTYKSMVFPETIKARGMEDLPDYFYRDDGNKVWEAIKSFVEDIVHIYYKSDNVVQKDEEIQAFVKDVCMFGKNRDNFDSHF
ncbi:hypothetical protein ANANG_G00303850 [Anguilla anguilla]|uniref:Lipoxygenase domain-containing protein n=1 Tax=Anguilla anguilla TaxID=7936 RepID=A0A9D3LJI8_ANGAN|nr:hypothetical protein ANANG_G00303850 [Anguilla anguilla]